MNTYSLVKMEPYSPGAKGQYMIQETTEEGKLIALWYLSGEEAGISGSWTNLGPTGYKDREESFWNAVDRAIKVLASREGILFARKEFHGVYASHLDDWWEKRAFRELIKGQ